MLLARPDQFTAMAPARPRILAQIVLGVNALCLAPSVLAQAVQAPTQPPAQQQQQQQQSPPQGQPVTPADRQAAAEAQALAQEHTVKYQVRIDAPRALRELLQNNLDLERWRDNAKVDLIQLRRMVRQAPEQVKTLVATEGYYTPTVTATLDTSGANPVAHVNVDPGPATNVSDVDIELRGFAPFDKGSAPFDAAALRNRWTLPQGSRFRTADWEAAKRNLLRVVTQSRFPRAELVDSSATVDPDKHQARLKVVIDSGPDVHFGGLEIQGLQRYPASIITNLNQIKPGDEYSEAALQALQGRLQDTGYFSTVEVSADMSPVLSQQVSQLNQGTAPSQTGAPSQPAGPTTLPVLVRVTENKRKNVSLGVGYSTNTGNRAQATYEDLSVFGKRNKSSLIYEQKQQTLRTDFYWPVTSNGYRNSVGAGYQRLDAEGQITRTTSIDATRAWGSPLLERSLTLQVLTEQVSIDDLPTMRAKAVPLTFSITKRHLDSLVQPTKGYIVNAQLGAAVLPVLTDQRFIRTYTRALAYKPLGEKGTLVLRGEFGAVISKDKVGVPTTFLFRAGGDQSVRGYGYQQLGIPVGSAITGGRYLLTGSTEYDYWFKPPWGAAVFYDFGNAADNFSDLKPKVGYGVGARWRSPVGPINVDLAYGKAVHKVRLHFSLGFTF
jgi:translocation and assembly module TamA